LKNASITIVTGALSSEVYHYEYNTFANVAVIAEKIEDLKNKLCNYDIIVTHYGLTAFEALYAGCAVALLHPSRTHKACARNSGFYSIPVFKGFKARIPKIINKSRAVAKKYNLLEEQKQSFADFIASLTPQTYRNCPVCGSTKSSAHKVISRSMDKTYRRCPLCKTIYMERLTPPAIEYNADYFFSGYKAQYGKTYLEDFPALREAARRRLLVIKEIAEPLKNNAQKDAPLKNSIRFLDAGCAYGAFLSCVKEEGFECEGIDPVKEAADYVAANTGVKVHTGTFPEVLKTKRFKNGSFDVLTMFYVIEHFTDCKAAVKAAADLLKKGGVFAFSTPSYSGVSGRFLRKKFFDSSPADHRTIWSPYSAKKVLTLFGFKIKKIIVTGHHPERFPIAGHYIKNKNFLYNVFMIISRIFNLGDTFEVYAVKN